MPLLLQKNAGPANSVMESPGGSVSMYGGYRDRQPPAISNRGAQNQQKQQQ